MERSKQLSNVAFGGGWVDAIERREELASAMAEVWRASQECMERDVRDDGLRQALAFLAARIAKGQMLADAFWNAVGLPPGRRQSEAIRLRDTILRGVGLSDQN